jgi:hypothetical protein
MNNQPCAPAPPSVRDAMPDELSTYSRDGYETWGAVLIEDGHPAGQIFLSRAFGQVFGHNTECRASDPRGAAMLWLRARKKAREWGAKEVWIHFSPSDLSMLPFWEKRGFTPQMILYRGEI